MTDEIDEKIDEIVEEKLEEADEELIEEARESLREEIENKEDGGNFLEKLKNPVVSRRKFLKMIGIGAGAAALPIPASAANYFSLGNRAHPPDNKVSALGRQVQRDRSGNVQFTTMGFSNDTNASGAGTYTFGGNQTFSTNERAVFEKLKADLGAGGSVKFMDAGNTITTKTGSDATTFTVTNNSNRVSPTFTAKVYQNNAPIGADKDKYTYTGSTQKCNTYGSSNTSMYTNNTALTGTGQVLQMGALLYQQANSMSTSKTYTGTFYFRVNGSTFYSTTLQASSGNDATSVVYANTNQAGTFTSPTVTWKVHNQATSHYGSMDVRWGDTQTGSVTTPAKLAEAGDDTRSFTVKRNKFTTNHKPL